MSHCGEKIALRANLRGRKAQIGVVIWETPCALSLGTQGRKMGEISRAEPAINKGFRSTPIIDKSRAHAMPPFVGEVFEQQATKECLPRQRYGCSACGSLDHLSSCCSPLRQIRSAIDMDGLAGDVTGLLGG